MSAPARLGLYALALVVVFFVAAVTANAVVPDDVVERWMDDVESQHQIDHDPEVGHEHP